MNWRGMVQALLRRNGYELVRYPIMHFLAQYEINIVTLELTEDNTLKTSEGWATIRESFLSNLYLPPFRN